MGLRNLALGILRRPEPASEPAWDTFGHTVLCAFARLRELEDEPKKHGGKAGAKQVRDRLEARQRAWKLFDEWAEDRRLDGRPVDAGSSMTDGHVDTRVCERNRNTLATMRKS